MTSVKRTNTDLRHVRDGRQNFNPMYTKLPLHEIIRYEPKTGFGFILLTSVISLVISTNPCPYNYAVCKIENSTLPELCCIKDCCNVESSCLNDYIRCVCRTRTLWDKFDLTPLDVEYTTVRGSSVVSGRDDIKARLEHTDGYLNALPSNICQYQLLLYIDVSNNRIKEIGNISCLSQLDTLDLSENRISLINNHTFQGLVSLRKLHLARNRISYIEPYSWSHQTSSILEIQLDDNELLNIDVTNVIINRPFCELSYVRNKIENVVNEAGWKLTAADTIVQGGMVQLTENNLTGIINFLELGVEDIAVFGKIFSYGIDMHDVPFRCDCEMEPFLLMAESALQMIWRSYFNMSCFYPEELLHRPVPDLVRTRQFDLLICDIPKTENCPYNCSCYKQPSKERVVVNCSGLGLNKMPEILPREDLPLEIFLDNNQITDLSPRGYLNRTKKLSLTNNTITTLHGSALNQLPINVTEIDLRGNPQIRDLPSDIQYFKPSNFRFGELIINCDCSNKWYGKWIKINEYEQGKDANNSFWCRTTDNVKVAAIDATEDFLECKESMIATWISVSLAVLTSLVLGISLIVKIFQYEIYLLFRTFKNKYKTYPDRYYDVYISYDETVHEINKWIMKELLPSLEEDGYRVCIPSRDFDVGVSRQEEIIHSMGRSNFVLVLLSKNERDFIWDLEWKQTWYLYTTYKIRNILLVNFDMVDYDSVNNPVLRAFVRLGMYFDFANMKQTLIADIKEMLGCSGRAKRRLENEFLNYISRFNKHDMLMSR
ncbi:protein toll-like [Ylistrum balloti]|uniref:protein toll-like n=1 Tax=Ylistrum balloti TaxID=509963 RepID=UPI002905E750|nr:protein toll-like [Ylistrum balloti]